VLGRLIGWPLLFTGAEIARAHVPLGGFSWGSLGASQHAGAPLLPLARVGGMWSVTLALVLVNALVAEAIAARRRFGRTLALVAAASAAVAPTALPLGAAGASGRTLDVAVVQGNVPIGHFTDLVRGRVGPEDEVILDNHITLSKTLSSHPPDLAIWPENALDRDPVANPDVGEKLSAAVAGIGRPVLVGAILDAPDGRYTNTNLLYAGDGVTLMGRYDKIHLVPFGEYVPWGWARRVVRELDQVPADGVAGRAARVLETGSARIGAVICFESSYPDLVRRFVRNGAEVIVVSTNNATFQRSPLARQHLAQSQMRAVEEGRTVVHAAISGISAIIGPDGEIHSEAGLFRPAIIRESVPLASGLTPYTRHGEAIDRGLGLGGAATTLLGLGLGLLRRRRPSAPPVTEADDDDEDSSFWTGAPTPGLDAVRESDTGMVEAPEPAADAEPEPATEAEPEPATDAAGLPQPWEIAPPPETVESS
jgi:apolipoprotein N-acyltransferase